MTQARIGIARFGTARFGTPRTGDAPVMAGLDPAIYRGTHSRQRAAIDGRVKPGHDGGNGGKHAPSASLDLP